MAEPNGHLTCCLCMYSAKSEKELEGHIDNQHAEIFRALQPVDVNVGSNLDPESFLDHQIVFWQNEPSKEGQSDLKNPEAIFPAASKRVRKSKGLSISIDDSAKTEVSKPTGAKPEFTNTSNSPSINGFGHPDGPTKGKRGRKSKISKVSVSNIVPERANVDGSIPVPCAEMSGLSGRKRARLSSTTTEAKLNIQERQLAGTISYAGRQANDGLANLNSTAKQVAHQAQVDPLPQNEFFERLITENEKLKLQMRQEMENERKAFLAELQIAKSEQDTKVFYFEDLKRNFEQVSSELEQLKVSSKAEIGKLKSDLEEATAANLELESRLITMSENYSKLELNAANGSNLEAEIVRLKQQSEQDRDELEQSKLRLEGLCDIVRRKNVQISQMKVDEERLELELKKWKSFQTDFKSAAEHFAAIKKSLEKVFKSDENFCQNVIGGNSSDKFENMNDKEICDIVEFVLGDYVAGKEQYFANLHFFNKKVIDLNSILRTREDRLKELLSKFNLKVNEVQSRIADTKKLTRLLEISNAEREKLSKKVIESTEELRTAKDQLSTVETKTKRLVHSLKLTLEQKDKAISDLEQRKATVNSDASKRQSEMIENLKNVEIHLKRDLNEQKLKLKELQNMIVILQKSNLHLENTIKKHKVENVKLKDEISLYSNRISTIYNNLDGMKKKVKSTIEVKDEEISKLEQQLQHTQTELAKLKKNINSTTGQVVDLS